MCKNYTAEGEKKKVQIDLNSNNCFKTNLVWLPLTLIIKTTIWQKPQQKVEGNETQEVSKLFLLR